MHESIVPTVRAALLSLKGSGVFKSDFPDRETVLLWLSELINRIDELEKKLQEQYSHAHVYIHKSRVLTKKNIALRRALMSYLRAHRDANNCISCDCIDCEFARAVLRHKYK